MKEAALIAWCLALMGICVSSGMAHDPGLDRCRELTSDPQRLACYDALSLAGGTDAAAVTLEQFVKAMCVGNEDCAAIAHEHYAAGSNSLRAIIARACAKLPISERLRCYRDGINAALQLPPGEIAKYETDLEPDEVVAYYRYLVTECKDVGCYRLQLGASARGVRTALRQSSN